MRHKIIALLILLIIFFGVDILAQLNSKINGPYKSVILQSVNLYRFDRVQALNVHEYWLLQKIADKTGAISPASIAYLKKEYQDSPFKRYVDKNAPAKELRFVRHIDKVGTFDFYTMPDTQDSVGTWDRVYLRAMYCDKTGYDDLDFNTMSSVLKNKGGYYDTHYLLYLLFLKEFHCYKKDLVEKEIKGIATAVIKEQSEDREFSDLYAERIVVLYWAGYGKSVKKEWIDKVAQNFHNEYGWNDKGYTTFSGHTTGLSLLSLIYFTEEKNKQALF